MALATATSAVALNAVSLGNMLAATHAWQNLTGTAIHYNHLPPPANGVSHTLTELIALRPFALIWTADQGYRIERDTPAGSDSYGVSGNLMLEIQRNTPNGENRAEADRSFENLWGRIIATGNVSQPGLMELAGSGSHLPIAAIQHLASESTDPQKMDAIGEAQRVFLHVHYALG